MAFSEEDRWSVEMRRRVIDYLAVQNVEHGAVGEWPAWDAYPQIGIWAIESKGAPGWVGWWAVAGNGPTDYVTCHGDRTPRTAVRDFGNRWKAAARDMLAGKVPDRVSFGPRESWPEIARPLLDRAETLLQIADDDNEWTWMDED